MNSQVQNTEQKINNQKQEDQIEKQCQETKIKITNNSIDQFNQPQLEWRIFQLEQQQPFQELLLITAPNHDINQQQQSLQIPDDQSKQVHQCQICQKKFKFFKALGGHMSKKHKGTSKKYKQKITKQERNSQTRLNRKILYRMICNIFLLNT